MGLLAALVAALVVPTVVAQADDGDTLRTFTADVPACSVNTGIAFDGESLYLSCWGVPRLYAVSPQDGALKQTIEVSGVSGIGAMAWDRSRDAVWVCDTSAEAVHLVILDGATATAEQAFTPSDGCIDGLAYDGSDDTLFTSGDVRDTVYHYDTAGTLLDSRLVGPSLGCGSSGIAVGGGDLFLANNGCSQIYRAANNQAAIPQFFAQFDRRIEDLECDDVTFADQGKAAIWAQDAYDAEIHAFELGIGDCGFGGLPPGGDFVMVAFGDSYQSGEGVGNSISSTTDYLNFAYEDGANFPERPAAQEDTYTDRFGGNGCHRALNNYAKINRDRLEPGAEVLLIDVTCSGAQIEPAGKPPIVGPVGGGIAPGSQVDDALEILAANGLTGDDVDLVTVGMGGNDAGFGDIVAGCLMPNLLRRLINAYPDPPGEISFLADRVANCQRLDSLFFDTESRIASLPPKEQFAHGELLGAFGNARIMQLNYPDILPSSEVAPAWCGGIARDDIDFAREKVTAIDNAIAASIAATNDDRLELVDIENEFGPNALCPGAGVDPLANGFAEANIDAEIARLLDVDGNGDAVARQRLDTLVAEYRAWKDCFRNLLNPFDPCNPNAQWDVVIAAWDQVYAHMIDQVETILANAIAPPGPGAESEDVRFDRSRGLFHPNARGFQVMACNVRADYLGGSSAACLEDPNIQPSTVDGLPFGLGPIVSGINDELEIELNGYQPNTPIYITYYSERVNLGQVMTDANGHATVQVQVPDAGPGVHRLEFAGTASGGIQRIEEIKVEVPGAPVHGQGYGVYVCGFDAGVPDDGVIEYVDVHVLEITFTEIPDGNGCIYLSLPIPEDERVPVRIDAVSRLTGERIVENVHAGDGATVEQWGGPVEAPPALNTINAGRTVPIDFRVVDVDGAAIDDESAISVTTRAFDCDDTEIGGGEIADDAGQSGLRGRGDGWWQFGWKTRRDWAGTCRTFTVTLTDGGRYDLWFEFA